MNQTPELIQRSGLPAGEYYVAVLYLWNNDNYSPNPYELTMTQTGGGGLVDVVLQYDDNSPDYGVYSDRWDFNEGVACYFVPPVTPFLLRGISYNFTNLDAFPGTGGTDGSFYVFGADYYGPILSDEMRYVTPAGTGWNFVDLTADQITLFGDFFAGMIWDRWNSPMLGWDTASTNGLNLVYTEIEGISGLVPLAGHLLHQGRDQLHERGHRARGRGRARPGEVLAIAELPQSLQPLHADRIRCAFRGTRQPHRL